MSGAGGRHEAPARLRVMLVEDDASLRALVRQAIEGPDLIVVAEAGTGHEAVTRVRTAAPDLILVDVGLPDLSGIDVVRALVAEVPSATIVMLTVSEAETDLFRAIEAGARGYLVKGLAPTALRRAVRAAARGELAMPRALAGAVVARLVGAPPLTRPSPPGFDELTPRELEVLGHLPDGLPDRDIANLLGVSSRTVESHVANILRKLGARNRAAATRAYLAR